MKRRFFFILLIFAPATMAPGQLCAKGGKRGRFRRPLVDLEAAPKSVVGSNGDSAAASSVSTPAAQASSSVPDSVLPGVNRPGIGGITPPVLQRSAVAASASAATVNNSRALSDYMDQADRDSFDKLLISIESLKEEADQDNQLLLRRYRQKVAYLMNKAEVQKIKELIEKVQSNNSLLRDLQSADNALSAARALADGKGVKKKLRNAEESREQAFKANENFNLGANNFLSELQSLLPVIEDANELEDLARKISRLWLCMADSIGNGSRSASGLISNYSTGRERYSLQYMYVPNTFNTVMGSVNNMRTIHPNIREKINDWLSDYNSLVEDFNRGLLQFGHSK